MMKKLFVSFLTLSIFSWPFPAFSKERPDLTIVSPQEGEAIFGDKLLFSFFVSNFILGTDGYLRLFLDQRKPMIIKEQKDFSFTKLKEGKHVLVAELVDKRRRLLSPPVKKEVTFASILPKEEKEIISGVSPPTREKETENLWLFSLVFFGLGVIAVLILTFKF